MKRLKLTKLILIVFSFIVISCGDKKPTMDVDVYASVTPVLRNEETNYTLKFRVINKRVEEPLIVEKIKISLEGTPYIHDIARVALLAVGAEADGTDALLAATTTIQKEIELSSHYQLPKDTAELAVSVVLKEITQLQNKMKMTCLSVVTNRGEVALEPQKSYTFRFGIAVHNLAEDEVRFVRIPALALTNEETLIAAFDARWESRRDVQGDIDIAIKRSSLRGVDWKPIHRVLDMGEYGGLPQKYNGVTDPTILVDKETGRIFIFGLWMHGIIDPETGKWVEGLKSESTEWNNPWQKNGSLSGTDLKRSSQLLMTFSDDDGITWSTPKNLTDRLKRAEWKLFYNAPGNGITTSKGVLVVPMQGMDGDGNPFSTIMSSTDHGKTWRVGNPVKKNTTECTVAELSDGRLMLNMRDNENALNRDSINGRAVFTTSDFGKRWLEHPTSRKSLVEPVCQGSLYRHDYRDKSGEAKTILLFMNPNSTHERRNMTLKVSFDDGMTWPEPYWICLDEELGLGYSSITSVDEKHIGVLYEGSRAQLVFQLIPLEDILKMNETSDAEGQE